jgi:hypothetical protein
MANGRWPASARRPTGSVAWRLASAISARGTMQATACCAEVSIVSSPAGSQPPPLMVVRRRRQVSCLMAAPETVRRIVSPPRVS